MTATLKNGSETVRWNLTELYQSPSDLAIEETLAWGLKQAQEFESKYKGRVAQLSPPDFAQMMQELEAAYEKTSRPSIYSHLLHTQNTANPEAGRLLARVQEAAAERGRYGVFFSLEMAQLSDEQAQKLFDHPSTQQYRHTIEESRKYRPHQLTEIEERLLNDISPVATSAWVRLFEELCASLTTEVRGEKIGLPQALSLQRDADRTLRQESAQAITKCLKSDLRTRAYIFNVILQDHSIGDNLRHYPTWISSRNLANETSDEAVAALVEAVTARYPIVARFYQVKKKLLGLDELFEWDRYAPIGTTSKDLTWDEAKDLVLESYRHFSLTAGHLVEDFFTNSWIDAPVLDNKAGGAYCMAATPKLHPFVMANFTGKLNDALTLAHELGHGLHDRLASRQNIFDYHPPLTLAETASVFGETLTFDRIMAEETDSQVRLSMLCSQIEGAFATIFRQVAMNRFEDVVHGARREQGELFPEQLGELWQAEITRMFGDSVTLTEDHRVWWSYVEHFIHTPGYVYAYAFGNLLALSIYQRYKENGPKFVDTYLEFLAAGGSQRPDQLVKTLDIDITDPNFWDSGLSILENMVSQAEQLSGVNN